VFLVLAALIPCFSQAQTTEGSSELSVSVGLGSIYQIDDGGGLGFVGGDGGPTVDNATGTLFITYRYYLNKRFALGAAAGVQTFWGGVGDGFSYRIDRKVTSIQP